MPELTNLTDRISHLRDREGGSPVMHGGEGPAPKKSPQKKRRSKPERRFATDYFMIFTYALLAIALITELALLVWLDLF